MSKLYTVQMNRWGDCEKHSYNIGIFSSEENAQLAGEAEVTWRAQKYDYKIYSFELDEISADKIQKHLLCDWS
jgi:hypothetical protein